MTEKPQRLPRNLDLKKITFRLPLDVKAAADELAKEKGITLTYLVTYMLARETGVTGYDLPDKPRT
ncbi:hypothetical protein [Rothia amarae]|uniref:hypothetical protein n=1 Tax=Rothia amarae TaxID=169480 RepID=UPI0033FAC3C8